MRKIPQTCSICGKACLTDEMRRHEPKCRLARMVPGAHFHILLNTRIVEVELICPSPLGGWLCKNLETGRTVRVRSHRRFREWMEGASYRQPPRTKKPALPGQVEESRPE